MRVEVEANQFVIRVYDEHADDYIASALVRVYGDKGWMSSITGAGFYKALASGMLATILQEAGVTTLEGYMTAPHARLLRMALRRSKVGDVTITHQGVCAGRYMPWVVVKAT